MRTNCFKSYLLFLLLSCFCSNHVFALSFVKGETEVSLNELDTEKDFDEKVEFKIELEIGDLSFLYKQPFLLDINDLVRTWLKQELTSSCHSLPELPPKFY